MDDEIENTDVCSFCFSDVSSFATTCPSCQATRRNSGGGWTSFRDGRRNDIIVAGVGLVLLFWVVAAILYELGRVGR